MRLFKNSILPFMIVMLLGSCGKFLDKDINKLQDNAAGDKYIAWGTIFIDPPATANNWSLSPKIYIDTDNGTRLVIKSSLIPSVNIENGGRIVANYTPYTTSVASGTGEIEVRLNMIYSVLKKDYITQSFINEDPEYRADSIGNDPIGLIFAGFGGRYLNIQFTIMRATDSGIKHLITLVCDDVTPRNDSVYLTLHHNNFGNAGSVESVGFVSFDIGTIIPEGAHSVTVILIYKDSDGYMKERSGTFLKPNN